MTMTPAPSLRTKPSRSLSKGRLARSGSSLRLLSASHGIESRDAQGIDAGLAAACQEGVGVAELDDAPRLADGVVRRGARADVADVRPLEAVFHADQTAGHVGNHHRDHEGRDPTRALVHEDRVLDFQRGQSADAAAEHAAEAGAVHGFEVDARVGERHLGRAHHQLRVAVTAADILRVSEIGQRIVAAHLAGDLAVVVRDVEGRDAPDAADAGDEVAPEGLQVVANRRDDAHARDDYSDGRT